jgi:hypothetical protein
VDKAVPPLEAEYHFTSVPLADKLATVAAAAEQNDWADDAVGGDGNAFTVRLI